MLASAGVPSRASQNDLACIEYFIWCCLRCKQHQASSLNEKQSQYPHTLAIPTQACTCSLDSRVGSCSVVARASIDTPCSDNVCPVLPSQSSASPLRRNMCLNHVAAFCVSLPCHHKRSESSCHVLVVTLQCSAFQPPCFNLRIFHTARAQVKTRQQPRDCTPYHCE